MRPLVFNEESLRDLARLRAHAEANVLGLAELKRRIAEKDSVGDKPEWTCLVPVGYRVCFSMEHQPIGLCRHLSVSVDKPGALPNPEAVNMIMAELGMKGTVYALKPGSHIYEENSGRVVSINVIVPHEDPAFLGGG